MLNLTTANDITGLQHLLTRTIIQSKLAQNLYGDYYVADNATYSSNLDVTSLKDAMT